MSRRFSGRKTLHLRLETCKRKYHTVEEIVDHLRSSYSDYSRSQKQPLTKLVRQALESMSPSSSNKRKKQRQSPIFQDDGDEEEFDNFRKKLKKVDKSEERLRQIEDSYIRRNRCANSQGSSSTNPDDRAEEDDDIDGEDGLVSEDAIYEQKLKPEIDLMRLMLMDRYAKLTPKKKANATQEENLEVDVNSDKSKQKIGGADEKAEGGKGLPSAPSMKVGSQGPTFNDFGGMKEVIKQLKKEVLVPLYHPQLPRELGDIKVIRGILFSGPPGCGKTKLAHAIANETGLPFYKISSTELVSGVSGASEENIRDLYSKAYRTAPSIVFIDEIDAITSKRENLQKMELRIVTQLITCMDESHTPANLTSDTEVGHVLTIGATNRPDAIDSSLRRLGRFDLEICLDVPDENARLEILSVVTRNHKFDGSLDLPKIAKSTPGFVGADLTGLANKAGIIAMNRAVEERSMDDWKEPILPEDMTNIYITMADYEEALSSIQPTLRREGFSVIPNVKWEDVGGLDSLREEFNRYIVRRIKYPENYENYDLESGFLLFGPPGCGKTLIAKAVASEAGANFIHIKGPELLSKYVGESEQSVRTLFNRARTCSPCILFFDELDALTKQRGSEGGWVVERVLNQLLIELDGGEERRGIFVIGATNRIDVIDNALLRPGRFGKLRYVRLPSAKERSLILKALTRNKAIDPELDLDSFARMEACEGLSGADLNALMNEAGMAAIEDAAAPKNIVKLAHFEKALAIIPPSVSKRDIQVFDRLAEQFKAKSH